MPYETQPRFSPDGREIAFTSDRGGGENIWLMNTDGSNRRQLTKETFTLLNNPTWSADGRFIAARKHFTTQRSAGTGEIWMYHVAGGGGVALVERPNPQFQKELGEPMFTPAGDAIYFSRNTDARQHLRICPEFEPAAVRDRALRHEDGGADHHCRRPGRRRPADAVAGRPLPRLRPPRAGEIEALREGSPLGRGAQDL
jgi:dipeptidyl aminopeptidase/acylaminoacyl peptidase